MPYNIEILHNILSYTDTAALWHSDKDYIKHYLNSATNKHPALVHHAEDAIKYLKSNPTMQAIYFKDLATIQKKDLKTQFPLWFKYHKKYLE